MKKSDLFITAIFALLFVPFFVSDELYKNFLYLVGTYPLATSFVKFAILATLGESIGLRIRTGRYNQKGFGLVPRALVWGFLGVTIKLVFVIFASGTPIFLEKTLGIDNSTTVLQGDFSMLKLIVAFSISLCMNVIYAPVMMTLHKITDTHILDNGGTISGLCKRIRFKEILTNINWGVMWNFVFKRTIPLFWIPAHTITFLLPEEFRMLFAAILGIALGIILAIAAQMKK